MAQLLVVCSACGSKVESLEVTICPRCNTCFEGEIGPEEQTPLETGDYCVACHQYYLKEVKVEPERLIRLNSLVSAMYKVTTAECTSCQATFEIKEPCAS